MLHIAYAKVEDKKEIEEFIAIVIKDTFKKNGFDDLEDFIDEEIEYKKSVLEKHYMGKGSTVFVGKVEGKVVATLSIQVANELIHKCTHGDLSNDMELGMVFVDPEYQKRGYGPKMIDKASEYLLDNGHTRFCFDSGYPSAQKIWTKKFGSANYIYFNHWGPGSHHMVWLCDIKRDNLEGM